MESVGEVYITHNRNTSEGKCSHDECHNSNCPGEYKNVKSSTESEK